MTMKWQRFTQLTFISVLFTVAAGSYADSSNSTAGNGAASPVSNEDDRGAKSIPNLALASGGGRGAGNASGGNDSSGSKQVDENEIQHLIFMREEEKLARDVYITLGMMYPNLKVFGNISASEERHTCSVCDKLNQYDIEDPVVNDNVGVFSGKEYGSYFTEKYQQLVARGEVSELEALYVGGFIEELDMMDIQQCPKVIVETDNGIDSIDQCGKVYTDNADIQRMYTSLLEGSKNHLRAFVNGIEKQIGAGNYEAQVLSQEQVDEILKR